MRLSKIITDKKILLAHGDSFTHGIGFPVIDGKSQRVKIEKPWPKLIASHYDLECVNLGLEGVSNEGIARDLLFYLSRAPDSEYVFVIVGWTATEREEWYGISSQDNNQGKWYSLNNFADDDVYPNNYLREYVKYMKTNEQDFKRAVFSKIMVQNYLKVNNIPYLFFETFPVEFHNDLDRNKNYNPIIKYTDRKSLGDIIKSKTYYPLTDLYESLIDSENVCRIKYWPTIEKLGEDYSFLPDDGHPNQQGHEYWAKYLEGVIDGFKL